MAVRRALRRVQSMSELSTLSSQLADAVQTAGAWTLRVQARRGGMLERFIQVDAVLYPGFSGGALVDADGAVLGMITSGLGFGGPAVAIPWSLVSQIAETIKTHGKVARGYLGIGSQPVTLSAEAKQASGGQERGLLVVQVA